MPESKTSPRRKSAVERQGQALELRMAGQTYQEIASSLGYQSASSALYAVEKPLGRVSAPEVSRFRKLNLGRLNKIVKVWWPIMAGDVAVIDKAVATDKVRAAIHDIRQLYGLDIPPPKELPPGSTPDKPLHVSAVSGQIDWDAIPDDLAEEMLDGTYWTVFRLANSRVLQGFFR